MKENENITSLWSAVWAMSLCDIVLIASEFMPVSLLTPPCHRFNYNRGICWAIYFYFRSICISN